MTDDEILAKAEEIQYRRAEEYIKNTYLEGIAAHQKVIQEYTEIFKANNFVIEGQVAYHFDCDTDRHDSSYVEPDAPDSPGIDEYLFHMQEGSRVRLTLEILDLKGVI